MVNNKSNLLRIIDETPYVINKKSSQKKKKAAIPGSSKFREPITQSKPLTDQHHQRHSKPTNVTSNLAEQYNEGDVSPLSEDQIRALEENDSFSRMFQRELEDLMIPAKSYGINVSDLFSNFIVNPNIKMLGEFYDRITEEEDKRGEWMDDILKRSFNGNSTNVSTSNSPKFNPYYQSKPLNSLGNRKQEKLEEPVIQNEFRLVCHYCRVMCKFYSVKEPQWNFYSIVSNVFAYRYLPLKESILAWSSLHLSIVEKTPLTLARNYFQSAISSVINENFLKSSIPIELLLASAFFLCHFDIMSGETNTIWILRHVWSTGRIGLIFEPKEKTDEEHNRMGRRLPILSAFAYQIITWLVYLDIRSALFIGNISFPDYIALENKMREVSTENYERSSDLEYLTIADKYESKAVYNIFANSRQVLSSMYGPSYPKDFQSTDDLQDQILVLMVKNMLMFGTLIRLRCWFESCGNSTEFDPHSVQQRIDALYIETQKLSSIEANDSVSRFHILIIKALVHASIIYFDRICNPNIRTNEKCQLAAYEILKVALQLREMRSSKTPGSTQWPFPLFIAGVETDDVVHQNWILEELENCEDEGWGLHIGKTRILLRECIRRQGKLNQRVDVGVVMEELTGYFIL